MSCIHFMECRPLAVAGVILHKAHATGFHQMVIKSAPGAMQPRLYCRYGYLHDVGDLLIAVSVHIAQHQDDFVLLRNMMQQHMSHAPLHFFSDNRSLRPSRRTCDKPKIKRHVRLFLSLRVDKGVYGNPAQPCADIRFFPKILYTSHRLYKRLLHEIVCVGSITAETIDQIVDVMLMFREKLMQSILPSCLPEPDNTATHLFLVY